MGGVPVRRRGATTWQVPSHYITPRSSLNLEASSSSDRKKKNKLSSVNRNVSFLLPFALFKRPPPRDPVTTSNPSPLSPGGSDVVVTNHFSAPQLANAQPSVSPLSTLPATAVVPDESPTSPYPQSTACAPVGNLALPRNPKQVVISALDLPPETSAASICQTPGPARYCNLSEAPLSNTGGLDLFDSSSSPLISSHEPDEGLTAALVSPSPGSPDSPTSFARTVALIAAKSQALAACS